MWSRSVMEWKFNPTCTFLCYKLVYIFCVQFIMSLLDKNYKKKPNLSEEIPMLLKSMQYPANIPKRAYTTGVILVYIIYWVILLAYNVLENYFLLFTINFELEFLSKEDTPKIRHKYTCIYYIMSYCLLSLVNDFF